MKKTTINFFIDLDKENVPENIHWQASDMNSDKPEPANAMGISLWDHQQKNTLRIDLWTKEMSVDEMKRYVIDSIGGFGQTILSATGDEFMSKEINDLCDRLAEHVRKEAGSEL